MGPSKSVRSIAALAALFSLGSCSPGFLIEASGFDTNIRLEFRGGGFLGRATKEWCITRLTVIEESWPTRAHKSVVWEVNAPKNCVTLDGLDVGHVPAGFTERVNKLPLRRGGMYGAAADADVFRGSSLPWFVCNGRAATIDWQNDYRLEDPPVHCRAKAKSNP